MILGLTGGYCAGKNTVASLLAQAGWICVDVDLIGHEALAMAKDEIAERFGSAVIGGDGMIDRKILAPLVFASPRALADHEAIIHPHMFRLLDQKLDEMIAEAEEAGTEPSICINAALLYKLPQIARCDAVIEVTASLPVRIGRGESRDGLSAACVMARIESQEPLWRLRPKDDGRIFYLDNSGDIAGLETGLARLLGQIGVPDREKPTFSAKNADIRIRKSAADDDKTNENAADLEKK